MSYSEKMFSRLESYDEATVFSVEELAEELAKLSNMMALLDDIETINLNHEDLIEQTENNIRSLMSAAIHATEVYK